MSPVGANLEALTEVSELPKSASKHETVTFSMVIPQTIFLADTTVL